MSGSVNQVTLIGNLGRDPETRTFPSGGKVCSLRLATSETWKDKNTGERREQTEWHTVEIFNEGLVRVAEQYLRKGSKVFLQGSLRTRKWQDQSGQDRYSTEVVLRGYSCALVMLDGRAEQPAPRQSDHLAEPPVGHHTGGMSRDMDDDIPFSHYPWSLT